MNGAKNSGAIHCFERAPSSHSTMNTTIEITPRQNTELVRILFSRVATR